MPNANASTPGRNVGSTPPLVLVMSGPSGSGKTSVAEHLLTQDAKFSRAITATTRAPRGEERHGEHYYFLDQGAFETAEAEGSLLESATVYGFRYGTPRVSVEAVLASGRHCLLVVDVQGVRALRSVLEAAGLEARYVFVRAPSLDALRERLEARGEDNPETIAARLAAAAEEQAEAPAYDLVLVNDTLEAAVDRLRASVREWTQPR